jgi:hypothetical protein
MQQNVPAKFHGVTDLPFCNDPPHTGSEDENSNRWAG